MNKAVSRSLRALLSVAIIAGLVVFARKVNWSQTWEHITQANLTILLAAVSTPWLVRGAAELGGSSVVAAVPLVMWVLVIGVLGVGGPGGDVLLTADWRSVLLLAGGMVPAAVALGRVLAQRRVTGSLVDTRAGEDTVQADGPFGYRE